MKKMNKKGFTLIELLAVIVILAIIMVIAVPQILNVIDKSRESAWESNIKMIEDAIETNEALITNNMASGNTTESIFSAEGCKAKNINKMADIDEKATTIAESGTFTPETKGTDGTITAQKSCEIVVSAKAGGEFNGRTAQKITCTPSGCLHANAQ